MKNLRGRIEAAEAKIAPPEHLGAIVVFDDEPVPANREGRQVIRVRFIEPKEVRHAD